MKWCVQKSMLFNKAVLSMHCIINCGPTSAFLGRDNISTDYEQNELKQIARQQFFPALFLSLTGSFKMFVCTSGNTHKYKK